MKTNKLLIFILVVALILALPMPALADDDDFDVDYEFLPEAVGFLGGNVQLTLTITNTGSTDITWVDIAIDTETKYLERWESTITSGTHRTVSFSVPFSSSDLGKQKTLQVSINNNNTTNPDGVKMFTFEIARVSDIFYVDYSITPDQDVYQSGDTITVTHRFTNNIKTHAALDLRTSAQMTIDGLDHIYNAPEENHGHVFPGATVTTSFDYTFNDYDAGNIITEYSLHFSLMGENYNLVERSLEFTVEALQSDINFTVSLDADPIEIDAGDTVSFNVHVANTGTNAINTFEIHNVEGGIETETEILPAGESGTVTVSADIYETCDVSYVVVGRTGDDYVSIETNSVTITVRDASTPEVTPSVAVSPSPSIAEETPTAEPSDTSVAMVEDTNDDTTDKAPNVLLYILIGVLCLLVIAAAVVIIVLANKKKQKRAQAHHETTIRRDNDPS